MVGIFLLKEQLKIIQLPKFWNDYKMGSVCAGHEINLLRCKISNYSCSVYIRESTIVFSRLNHVSSFSKEHTITWPPIFPCFSCLHLRVSNGLLNQPGLFLLSKCSQIMKTALLFWHRISKVKKYEILFILYNIHCVANKCILKDCRELVTFLPSMKTCMQSMEPSEQPYSLSHHFNQNA